MKLLLLIQYGIAAFTAYWAICGSLAILKSIWKCSDKGSIGDFFFSTAWTAVFGGITVFLIT